MVYARGGRGQPTQSPNKGPWIRGRWLWHLANQLYRPATPSITPTVRIGFAVNGGGGSGENIFPFLRSIPKKCHCSQALTVKESRIPDAGNAIRNYYVFKATASIEG